MYQNRILLMISTLLYYYYYYWLAGFKCERWHDKVSYLRVLPSCMLLCLLMLFSDKACVRSLAVIVTQQGSWVGTLTLIILWPFQIIFQSIVRNVTKVPGNIVMVQKCRLYLGLGGEWVGKWSYWISDLGHFFLVLSIRRIVFIWPVEKFQLLKIIIH